MGNMSYCRFENTYQDLQDCYENMDDEDLSESEERYKRLLIKLCQEITDNYGETETNRALLESYKASE